MKITETVQRTKTTSVFSTDLMDLLTDRGSQLLSESQTDDLHLLCSF